MLPILGTVGPLRDAEPCAEALGRAFQLTNFLRDVSEDLDRNRVYLPADELAAFGVDRELLTWCHDNQRTDPGSARRWPPSTRSPGHLPRGPQGHRAAGPAVAAVRHRGVHPLLGDSRSHRGTSTSRCSVSGPRSAWAGACRCSPAVWCGPTGRAGCTPPEGGSPWATNGGIWCCWGLSADHPPAGVVRCRRLPPAAAAAAGHGAGGRGCSWCGTRSRSFCTSGTFQPDYISGINVPFMPLEEMLFFIVIPLCALLTTTRSPAAWAGWASCGATVRRAANDRTRIHAARGDLRGGGLCAGIGGTAELGSSVSPPTGYRW